MKTFLFFAVNSDPGWMVLSQFSDLVPGSLIDQGDNLTLEPCLFLQKETFL